MPDENFQRIDKLESHRLKKEVQRRSGFMQTLELERMKSNVQKPPHYQRALPDADRKEQNPASPPENAEAAPLA